MLLLLRLLSYLAVVVFLCQIDFWPRSFADAFSVALSTSSPIRRTASAARVSLTAKDDEDSALQASSGSGIVPPLSSSSSSPTEVKAAAAVSQLQQRSQHDLIQMILQYEQQMQSFVIQAQREKLRAVREAEDALLAQWASTSSSGSSSGGAWLSSSSSSTTEVQQRDAKIVTEGARNTRWGPQEIARIQLGAGRVGGGPPSSSFSGTIATATATATDDVSDATIAAADHGLRADGGVGGPTLAERVRGSVTVARGGGVVPSSVVTMDAVGAAMTAPPTTTTTTTSHAFAQRTSNVAQQGARNTRWGQQEIQRAQKGGTAAVGSVTGGPPSTAFTTFLRSSVVSMSSTTADPADMIQQADHGLRADGGVGGPSLAERVNVGAQLLASDSTVALSSAASSHEYAQRNKRIQSVGTKDTRWGAQEIARVAAGTIGSVEGGPPSASTTTTTAAAAPSSPILRSSVVTMSGTTATTSVPADVIAAADHGLRADGGVSGPTLADRVNVGAQLLSAAAATAPSSSVSASRDSKVAAEGTANTRWGPQEVARVQAGASTGLATGGPSPTSRTGGILPSSVVTIGGAAVTSSAATSATVPDDIIAAADHGLRADGGVGGPSLAERLNSNDVGSPPTAATATVPPPVNGHAAESPPVFFATTTVVSNEFQKRNANVAASGPNNTRWGAQEIARAQTGATATGLASGGPASSVVQRGVLPSTVVTIGSVAAKLVDEATIAAADHGLRADGGVGGPTLADRLGSSVNVGAQIVGNQKDVATATMAAEFKRRNSKITQDGAKNTRWGAQEIVRVSTGTVGAVAGGPPSSAVAAPALRSSVVTLNGSGAQEASPVSDDIIVAADHGLRADGGVGGPTLADRLRGTVNVGAQIVSGATPSSLYEQRNRQVAAAASQSRWGAEEINRVQSGAGGVGSNPPAPIPSSNIGLRILTS